MKNSTSTAPSISERVTAITGALPICWTPMRERGCTANKRWVIKLNDGNSAFVKAAVDEQTADWLRKEHAIYSQINAPFMPQLLGWDDGELPVLILEDLHEAHWPPPWQDAAVNAVRATLEELAAIPLSEELRTSLPSLQEACGKGSGWPGWQDVAQDPEPFLRLGFCSSGWLDKHLTTLLATAEAADLRGDSLLHMDTRSDNLCLRGNRALLIDWNWVRVGNPLLDIVGWLPSLHAEGGPAPEKILPDGAAELVALICGYWAAKAGLPSIPEAPRVRPLQLAQLRVAFPWMVRALNLPMPASSVSTEILSA